MIVANADFGGAVFSPSEDDPPLLVDADGVKAVEIPLLLKNGSCHYLCGISKK